MDNKLIPWDKYEEILISYGYNEDNLKNAKFFRETLSYMSFEQFLYLCEVRVVKRVAKLRKPRCLFVGDDGKIWYLNHKYKRYNTCGFFVQEKEE